MKLFTDLGDSSKDIFSKILLEARMQRANDKTRIHTVIESKINKYICHYKALPELLKLGANELQWFPESFRYVSSENEVIVLRVEATLEASGISLVKPKNRESVNEI